MRMPNLEAEMARTGIAVDRIAEELQCTSRTAWNKVHCVSPLTFNEAKILRDNLFSKCDYDYLFELERDTA